ncbi:MAG: peptidase S41, partial [Bacteroidales bacterium]|nr:peptidase S41 [Bacteroidales bacterium]
GTTVKLTIQPYGHKGSIVKEITRKEIKLPSITYTGMLSDGIGYIRLAQFTEHAGKEVKEAFLKLKEQQMRYLVLDLRGNGGGLLNEAVNIVSLFVPKGELVVSTKGKQQHLNQQFYTTSEPIDKEIPIAVLVDGHSASASEIVAGTLQDLDRAVIIGERTYGKGLVQNVLPLSYNSQMKVTVSKYYIPSGRCIQKIDYQHKDSNGVNLRKADSNATAFRTRHGRTVYDYGGVEPDMKVKPEPYSTVLLALISQKMIFNYANEYRLQHKTIPPVSEFTFTDAMYADFVQFVEKRNIVYETFTEKAMKQLEAAAKEDKTDKILQTELQSLKNAIGKDKATDLQKYRKEISEMLHVEIIGRYYYQKGESEAALQYDPCMETVRTLFGQPDYKEYRRILGTK